MNKAEVWLGERMTVRRWLYAVGGVSALVTLIGFALMLALKSDEGEGSAGYPVSLGGVALGEQRPASMYIAVNVGSIGILDGRAGVTLDLYPTRQPVEWAVTVRAPGAGNSVREIDLKNQEVREFARAIDDALRHRDPEHDITVAGTTIHASEPTAGDVHFDLKSVGVLRLDADAMGDLRRMLDKAEAHRAWLLPRTIPLRNSGITPLAAAAVVNAPMPGSNASRNGK